MAEYKSRISFRDGDLSILLDYEGIVTKESEEGFKKYFQWRFSEKAGRPVSADEIETRPKAGDKTKFSSTVTFSHDRCKPNTNHKEFLEILKSHAPYVLPRLAEDLTAYKRKHFGSSSYHETKLIDEALEQINQVTSDQTGNKPPIIRSVIDDRNKS